MAFSKSCHFFTHDLQLSEDATVIIAKIILLA
jgi:hypothetical protein